MLQSTSTWLNTKRKKEPDIPISTSCNFCLVSSIISRVFSISVGFDLIQSWAHIKASAVFGVSELLNGSITLPPTLNADSEATVVIGIARTFFAA